SCSSLRSSTRIRGGRTRACGRTRIASPRASDITRHSAAAISRTRKRCKRAVCEVQRFAASARAAIAPGNQGETNMCGLVGIVGQEPVNQSLYDALTGLQHRGQDAAGIMTDDGGRLRVRKSNGLVRDVFQERHMLKLAGNVGLGHVRYPTAG